MKRVRDYLKEQEPSGPSAFNTNISDYENQGGDVTGGGRVQNYPVSASALRFLRNSGGSFSFGFLSSYTESELNLILQGTNLSGSVIYSNRTEYDALGDRQVEEQNAAIDYFDGEYQTIRAGYEAQYDAAIAAEDYEAALRYVNLLLNGPHVQEYDRLTDIYVATAEERSALLRNMSTYIETGKINSYDPYGLDHPELTAQRKKREEIERNIEASLKQLAKDNEELKSEGARRNILGLVDLGFDIATAIAILNVFAGPGDELSIQGLKLAAKEFFKKGAKKTATKTATKTSAKKYGKIQQVVDDELDDLISKMPISKNPLTPDQALRQQGFLTKSGVAHDDFIRQVASPETLTRASSAIKQSGTNATIPIKVQGKTIQVKASDILKNKGFKVEFHKPEGKVLTESQKRVLKNIKKPYEVPELPKKYKMNFAGKYSPQNTPDKTASQISDTLVASGNARGQRWRQKDKDWVGYETSERMNIVYDRVGHGDQYWNMIVNDNSRKKKDRELQEKLNIIAHEKALMQENPNYQTIFNQNSLDEQETLSADKDPLFKKVSNSLKKSIDYPDKPSKNGYPNDPPPKMIDGYHPDLVNGQRVSNYYNRLDPHSAEAMPLTGNSKIDVNVKKSLDAKQKARKIKNLRGKG